MSRLRAGAPVLGALAAGLALWAAFPPLGLWWAAPLGVAALLALSSGRGVAAGAGLGAVFGLGLFTPLLHFTAVAMGNSIGWVALVIVESAYLAALGGAWALVSRVRLLAEDRPGGPWARIVAWTVLWCAVEELRSSWPLGGFPFGRLAYAMVQAPALPVAAYGGSLGLSALVAMVAACLVQTVRALGARRHRPALVLAATAGALLLAPTALPVPTGAENGTLRVGVVQGNVATDFEDAFARALEVTGNHARATQDLAQDVGPGSLDLVIWPENSADLDPRTHPDSAVLVEQSAQAVAAPVLVGAVAFAEDVRYNDVVVWSPGTGPGEYYRKHRPVPFAEYVPWRPLVRAVTDQADRIGTDMAPGTGAQTLTVRAATQGRDVTLAMGICFEVAYDGLLREGVAQGGEVIVIPTNNASFLTSSEAAQQLAQGRVQAVVHGRTVVQVSTVGITAIISPSGEVVQRLRPYTSAGLVADVPLRTSTTVADRLGAAPAVLVQVGGALLAAAGIVEAARRRRGRAGRRLRRADRTEREHQ
ncbi:MAG: apolipoprotein N-acyltransferase [Actinomyces sp.]|uniref:apolipoprotein N-acyltransferase n=1 Tax=Actinomyces sp. TaxID=29317 RepID=UPI0026DD5237|nr:apolipoprotein N-acyltransferase [Actinomyces sp.]MDO4243311.1 apolipoprotein N-acyltransferase [Actinomyces sp.]